MKKIKKLNNQLTQEEIMIIITALMNEKTFTLTGPFLVKKSYIKKIDKISDRLWRLDCREGSIKLIEPTTTK